MPPLLLRFVSLALLAPSRSLQFQDSLAFRFPLRVENDRLWECGSRDTRGRTIIERRIAILDLRRYTGCRRRRGVLSVTQGFPRRIDIRLMRITS